MGRKLSILLILLLLVGLAWGQTTINGSRTIKGYWNAGGAVWTIPFTMGTDDPASCQIGEVFFDTDAVAGFNIKLCTASDTWTTVQASGSGLGDMTKAEYDTNTDSTVDLAAASTALAANGANCSSGQAPLGVDASGAVEGCWTPSAGGATPAGAAGNVQYNLDGTSLGAESAFSYNSTSNTLTSGKFLVSDSCTLGNSTTATAGTLCSGGSVGLLMSDGSNWYTANWSNNNTGEIWYSDSNYAPTSTVGFSFSLNVLTVPTIKPTTSIQGKASNTIPFDPDSDGTIESSLDASGNFSGTSAYATALAANGANCSAGQAPLGVDSSGAVEGCWTPSGSAPNLWATIDTPSGTDLTADNTADTLILSAGTGISLSGDGTNTLTITNSAPNTNQNIWSTINTSSGTDVSPDGTATTLNLTAGAGITITGDGTATVTIASTVTGTGDELTVDGTDTATPNLDDGGDINFAYSSPNITATVKADSVALGTDTTGNYAGSSSEGGAATRATTADKIDADADGTPEVYVSGDTVILDPDGDGTSESNISSTGAYSGSAAQLASDPSDCSANQFAQSIAASGNLTCATIADADVPDTITASNYLPLAGGTLTGNLALSGDASEGLSGGGLTDCDNATTSKLLWDTTTNKFSCGTDQTGAGGGDEVSVDSTATTNPDFQDGGDINFAYNTGVVTATVKADSVALGTDTTGNYAGSSSEGGAATRATTADKIDSDADGTFEVSHSSTTISFDPDDDGTAESTIDATGNFSGRAAIATMADEIEDGTGVTADSAGEIKLDTTANQLVYYGTASRIIDPRQSLSAVLMAPVDADTPIIFKAPYGMTITDIDCIVGAATSAVIDVQECTSAGASCATVDATITCDTDGAADDGTLSNGSIDAGDWIKLDIGTVTGTVGYVSVTIQYIIVQE